MCMKHNRITVDFSVPLSVFLCNWHAASFMLTKVVIAVKKISMSTDTVVCVFVCECRANLCSGQ